ncbi:O-unit flippase-like protein [Pectobacterium versatile]|uniref:O-unit flippase-like protein n=1 Tax=Pectobacterium versatile TaxID=2488639 RepID=UPI001F352F3A|nr:O-unit flippase-like protein [Pectobacterium versatile]
MRFFNKDVFSGYFSQGLNILYGILVLPFILTVLNPSEVAYWMLLLTLTGFSAVLDFGFSPTITRAVSYAFNGSTSLKIEGYEISTSVSEPNWLLIGKILKTSQRIYLILSLVSILVIGGGGSLYILNFFSGKVIKHDILTWFLFLIGYFLNIYYLYTIPILMGIGKIYHANKINIIIRMSWLVIGVVGVLFFKSVLAFAISQLIGVVLGRVYGVFLINKSIHKSVVMYDKDITSALIPNSWRMGVVSLATYIINKSSVIIGGVYLSSQALAGFTVSIQILGVISTFSQTYFNLKIPHFAALRILGDTEKIKKFYCKTILLSLFVFLFLSIFVVLYGPVFLDKIGARTVFPEKGILLLVFIFGFLELNHTLAATFITTKNTVPFLKSAILSGFFILLGIFIMIDFTANNILVLIVVPGVVQLCYNNWKWPLLVFKDLNRKG